MSFFIGELYGKDFDFPQRKLPPWKRYMVAAIPRTGSTYLCTQLWRTGLLGAPLEYINLRNITGIVERFGNGDPIAYWRKLQEYRTSPNGVFGFKAFIPDYQRIANDHEEFLPEIHSEEVIYITRRNKVAQAVSYARATVTAAWFAGVPEKIQPTYDFKKIATAEKWIADQEAAWEFLFNRTKVRPLRIQYEDLLSDPQAAVDAIAKRVGVELSNFDRIEMPGLERQSGAESIEWAARFIAEREQTKSLA
jgi:LPS sulfotransferase NodH